MIYFCGYFDIVVNNRLILQERPNINTGMNLYVF